MNTEATSHQPDKTTTILVNGQEKQVDKGKISYETVVDLAYGSNVPDTTTFDLTVSYRRGKAPHAQGELNPGGSVEVVEGMIFNVTPTKKS